MRRLLRCLTGQRRLLPTLGSLSEVWSPIVLRYRARRSRWQMGSVLWGIITMLLCVVIHSPSSIVKLSRHSRRVPVLRRWIGRRWWKRLRMLVSAGRGRRDRRRSIRALLQMPLYTRIEPSCPSRRGLPLWLRRSGSALLIVVRILLVVAHAVNTDVIGMRTACRSRGYGVQQTAPADRTTSVHLAQELIYTARKNTEMVTTSIKAHPAAHYPSICTTRRSTFRLHPPEPRPKICTTKARG